MLMPDLDSELCNNCGLCIIACHGGGIICVEGKVMIIESEKCDFCGVCEAVCAQKAIRCYYSVVWREHGIEI